MVSVIWSRPPEKTTPRGWLKQQHPRERGGKGRLQYSIVSIPLYNCIHCIPEVQVGRVEGAAGCGSRCGGKQECEWVFHFRSVRVFCSHRREFLALFYFNKSYLLWKHFISAAAHFCINKIISVAFSEVEARLKGPEVQMCRRNDVSHSNSQHRSIRNRNSVTAGQTQRQHDDWTPVRAAAVGAVSLSAFLSPHLMALWCTLACTSAGNHVTSPLCVAGGRHDNRASDLP